MISKLLRYCFSSWHTASYFISSLNQKFVISLAAKMAVFNFFNYGVMVLNNFHETMTEDDRFDAMLFRKTCIALTDFISVFMKQYQRFRDSEWFQAFKVLECQYRIREYMKKSMLDIMEYFNQQTMGSVGIFLEQAMKGIAPRHNTCKNNNWTRRYVINKFIKILYISNLIIQSDYNEELLRLEKKYKRYLKIN